jgi:hypothetical protein
MSVLYIAAYKFATSTNLLRGVEEGIIQWSRGVYVYFKKTYFIINVSVYLQKLYSPREHCCRMQQRGGRSTLLHNGNLPLSSIPWNVRQVWRYLLVANCYKYSVWPLLHQSALMFYDHHHIPINLCVTAVKPGRRMSDLVSGCYYGPQNYPIGLTPCHASR